MARVCTGRAGPHLPRTPGRYCFLADHSRSKDTVLKEVPEEWVKAQGLLEVRTLKLATKISPDWPGYGPPPVCRSC